MLRTIELLKEKGIEAIDSEEFKKIIVNMIERNGELEYQSKPCYFTVSTQTVLQFIEENPDFHNEEPTEDYLRSLCDLLINKEHISNDEIEHLTYEFYIYLSEKDKRNCYIIFS